MADEVRVYKNDVLTSKECISFERKVFEEVWIDVRAEDIIEPRDVRKGARSGVCCLLRTKRRECSRASICSGHRNASSARVEDRVAARVNDRIAVHRNVNRWRGRTLCSLIASRIRHDFTSLALLRLPVALVGPSLAPRGTGRRSLVRLEPRRRRRLGSCLAGLRAHASAIGLTLGVSPLLAKEIINRKSTFLPVSAAMRPERWPARRRQRE